MRPYSLIFPWLRLAAACSAMALALVGCAKDSPPPAQAGAQEVLQLRLHTQAEMDEIRKLTREDPKTYAVRLYCTGDIVDAQKLTNGPPGCTSGDCRRQWVTNPPTQYLEYCNGNVCPLNATTWYPTTCSNLLFNRCQVRLGNINTNCR